MHWTYKTFDPEDDLQQGDLLDPTEELKAVLQQVHPHFASDKYLGFSVATQSCDLVWRGAKSPKARYVSIAVVRSLRQVLPALLSQVVTPVASGLFRTGSKQEAKRFLKRLFDQNEQALGLFYLHPDADVGIGEPAVVYLRVSVALKAQHYEILKRARRGRLHSDFVAKFGWLLGNLYSRAASPDWSDFSGGKKEIEQLIGKYLAEQIVGAGPAWVDDQLVDAAEAAGVAFEGRSREDLLADLEKHRPRPVLDQLVDETVKVASGVFVRVEVANEDRLRLLRNRLLNNGVLRRLIRSTV